MKTLSKIAFASLLGASSLALVATAASARIVCNEDGDCWHSKADYEYKPDFRLSIHPDDWKWKETEHLPGEAMKAVDIGAGESGRNSDP